MADFKSIDELYQVIELFLSRIAQEPEIAAGLLKGKMVVRLRWKDPDGEAFIDLRSDEIKHVLGPSDLVADVELISSADNSNKFWSGNLKVAQAIATRKIIARGSVPKALQLMPAVQPAFPLYRQVLRDLGREDLLPSNKPQSGRMLKRSFWHRIRPRVKQPEPDWDTINRHLIPIVDGDGPIKPFRVVAPFLPAGVAEFKREMLRSMMLIRTFEQHLGAAFARGDLPTEAIHLSIGQEATAVGACFALKPGDGITTTHRGHGHVLAKGANLENAMAEMYGKATGLCRGKGGSMHLADSRVNVLGANGIVGAAAIIAVGAALAARQQGTDDVCLTFLGDGSTNQGMFHEAANFAAVFDLPLIFLLENNLYGEFTPLSRHTRVERLADRALAYGMPGVQVDGNDVWAVYKAVDTAAARARAGDGPTLVECLTYRWHGHMEGESVNYRPESEIIAWKERDPIALWQKRLLAEQLIEGEEASALQKEVKQIVVNAASKAQSDPTPSLDSLAKDVFSPDPATLYRVVPVIKTSRTISFSEALWEALAEEMARDPSVFLLGEDVSTGGYFSVTAGLAEEFSGRVLDTPISEYAIGGAAVGSSMKGQRPVAEILFSDFLTTCMDPIVNQAAKIRYMSGGQFSLPLVIRSAGGAGLGFAAQHSQSFESLLAGIPGLIIMVPSTPRDAKGMLKAAIRSNNPVLFFENKLLYLEIGEVPEEEYIVPIGQADVKRQGEDVTVVAVGGMVPLAMEAAKTLAAEGLSVEVVDPRTLAPLDLSTIMRSVIKTGRLVTVEEGTLNHGFGADIVARIVEISPNYLKTPPRRVAALDIPIAFARNLERATIPDVEQIRVAILEVMS
jgi:2-oxoisovalerate dehydrogenase E1 component